MADDTTPANEAATTPTSPAPEVGDETKLGDPGKAALDAERRARRDAERQLKEATAQLQALQDAGKTDLEKALARAEAAEKERDTYRTELTGRERAATLAAAARDAHAVNPDLVASLLSGRVDWGDGNTPGGLPEAVEALQSSDPYLFAPVDAGARDAAATGHTTGAAPDLNQLIRAAAR